MAIYGLRARDAFELRSVDGRVAKVLPGFLVRNCGVEGSGVILQVIDPEDPAAAVRTECPEQATSEQLRALHERGSIEYIDGRDAFDKALTSQAPAGKAAPKEKKKGQNTTACLVVLGVILLAVLGASKKR